MTRKSGIHTYSISKELTNRQYQEIIQSASRYGRPYQSTWAGEEKSTAKRTYRFEKFPGVQLTLYNISKDEYNVGIKRVTVQIEPCRLLGDRDPTALFHPTKQNYGALLKRLGNVFATLSISGEPDTMPLCRVDITENIFLDSPDMVQGYLHVLKKSLIPRDYKLEKFHKGKAKDVHRANQHSHCLKANHVTVLAYDKVDQLQMIGRGDELIDEKSILRIEVQMKRKKFLQYVGEETVGNRAILKELYRQREVILEDYRKKMGLVYGDHFTYQNAVHRIERNIKKPELRERMLLLLRKCSDRKNLTQAIKYLEEEGGASRKQIQCLLEKFRKIGVSPISLPNACEITYLQQLGR